MRRIGNSDLEIYPLGLGGNTFGNTTDPEASERVLDAFVDAGGNHVDTADSYSAWVPGNRGGESETILGEWMRKRGNRHSMIIATKVGAHPEFKGLAPANVIRAAEASLRRLQTDYIDLYQLHFGDVPDEEIGDVWATLDQLQKEGLIRSYGWSMGNAERADVYAKQTNGTALQFGSNVLGNAPELFAVCERHNLASVVNSPLGMGLLSGKFDANSRLPADDVRAAGHSWVTFFADGRPRPEVLERLAAVREILTSGGRTLAQGALAWVWARSPKAIPIPGFKTLRQIEENAGALRYGPLTDEQMREIESLLAQQAAV